MLKKIAIVLATMTVLGTAQARDDTLMLPLQDVIQMGLDSGKLDGSVKFYLAGAKTPAVRSKMGEGMANKKTNGFGKDDVTACKWAALSALVAFEGTAKKKGANAVIGLHSFYKRNVKKDPVNYECHAGNVIAGVTLQGTYARVGK